MIVRKQKIQVLKQLSDFIIPPGPDELVILEKSILEEGCREALIVWEKKNGQYILVDGHNRFRICQKHNLPFKTRTISFSSIEDAKLWMMNNQMGRRNLLPDQISYYRGLRYIALKKEKGGYASVASKGQQAPTKDILAEKFSVSESTIKRDAKYAEGLDIIAISNPKLKASILTGGSKVKKADIQILSEAKNASKLVFRNEADLYNKAKVIREGILDEVEKKVKSLTEDRIEKAQKTLGERDPMFLKKEDQLKRIKGMILSAINKAIDKKDASSIKELQKLVERLADVILA